MFGKDIAASFTSEAQPINSLNKPATVLFPIINYSNSIMKKL
jgi:hypothetical protein